MNRPGNVREFYIVWRVVTQCSLSAEHKGWPSSDAVYKIAVPRDESSVECENVSDVCSCLCLMCELSRVPPCVNDVAKLLPCLAAAANHKHYSHHVFFLQSVCKQVVELCQPCLHFITSVVLRLSVTCCFLYTTHYYRSSKLIKRILSLV